MKPGERYRIKPYIGRIQVDITRWPLQLQDTKFARFDSDAVFIVVELYHSGAVLSGIDTCGKEVLVAVAERWFGEFDLIVDRVYEKDGMIWNEYNQRWVWGIGAN